MLTERVAHRTTFPVTIAGQTVLIDHSGTALLPETGDLLVADLHLEKGSAFAARGQAMLPPYDTLETLRRLDKVIARLQPIRVICMGDTLHDLAGETRMSEGARKHLAQMVGGQDWIWIAGNHDPVPPTGFGGSAVEELQVGDLLLRHDTARSSVAAIPAGEVIGHYHPKAAVRARGRRISGRCFVTDGRLLILPAFGGFTGGLNASAPAITCLLKEDFRVYMIGPNGLFGFRRDQLIVDPQRAA